jgi:hypothetical protein
MFAVFNIANKNILNTRIRLCAYNIARGVMEEFSDWTALDSLDSSTDGTVSNAFYQNRTTSTLNNIQYNCSIRISNGPVSYVPAPLKQMDVIVSWFIRKEGNITISTYKTDY